MGTKKQTALLAAAGIGIGLAARAAWRRISERDISSQTVLITGGSRGLGLAMAQEFLDQGCRLALCARDQTELEQARLKLTRQGAEGLTIPCDVTDRAQVAHLIETVTQHYGRIDILVNNAGVIGVGPAQNMTAQDFEEAMQTDFWGVLNPTLAVLPQMRERQRGCIVNISSVGGKISVPHLLPYSCAKFAVTGLSEGLRAELKRDRISVTTICPGTMRTGSHYHAEFKGNTAQEFNWFSAAASIPGLSISAERAAREIVQAAKRGDAERILGLDVTLAALLHGVAPGLTTDLFGVVNQTLLPAPSEDDTEKKTGSEIEPDDPSPIRDKVTTLGRSAAERLNEHPPARAEER